MHIREAQPQDRSALIVLWGQSVRATHYFLSDADIRSLLPVVRDQALAQLELWVLCTDGTSECVGFMGLDGGKLEALFITPAWFRRGCGRLLLAHARSLKGALQVDVNEDNPHALRFYLANGFAVSGRSAVDAQGQPFPLLHLSEAEPTAA